MHSTAPVARMLALVIVLAATPVLGFVGQREAAAALQPTADCTIGGDPSFDDRARQVVCQILAGRFGDVRAQFDSAMMGALTEDQLRDAWRGYIDFFGDFQSAGDPTSTAFGPYIVEQVPVRMSKSEGEIRVTYNPDGSIAGLFFLRPGVPIQ